MPEIERRPISCTVRLSHDVVLARASFTLRAHLTSEPPRDLRGLTLRLLNAEGAVVTDLVVATHDGTVSATNDVEVRAPATAGPQAWTLRLHPQEKGGVAFDEAHAAVAFVVVAHPVRANVWGLPTAPVAGSTVNAMVGAKGSDGTSFAGRRFEVADASGAIVADGRFGSERTAGSAGLFQAEVALPTPAEPGIVCWTLTVPGFDEPLPHAAASHAFTVRTVAAPDVAVTVTALDLSTRAPIPGARIVLHPVRGVSDAAGRATVAVTRGAFRLFVTAAGYEIWAADLEVGEDLAIDAELNAVVEPDVGDHYV